MPNNFFSVDSRFPNIENKTQDEINAELVNYLYMLLEQLRYTMGNLGVGNFNESELNDIAGMISSPIYAKIEDAEGNITQLSLTAEQPSAVISSALLPQALTHAPQPMQRDRSMTMPILPHLLVKLPHGFRVFRKRTA